MNTRSREKAALRARFRRYRVGLSEAAYREASEAITGRARKTATLEEARTVMAYWPLTERREIDTRGLIRWLAGRGTAVALPVIDTLAEADGNAAPRMHAVRFEGPEQLRRNRWGVYEPSGTETVPDETIDAVIVPAFGAGRNMHRIGHGKGYYDAFLARCSAATICLVYGACFVPEVPAEPHDVAVDAIVTETELIATLTTS